MKKTFKKLIKKTLNNQGYEIHKITPKQAQTSAEQVVATMFTLVRDLKKRGLHCSHIMDIGANWTKWSRMVKGFYPEAKFCLVEPQDELKDVLDNYVNDYPEDQYHLKGVGSKKEELLFTIWEDLAGSSFLPDPNDNLQQQGRQRKVELTTIDDIIEENNFEIPQLIKLDIQGFELEALKGAQSLFGNTEVFILEVSLFAFGAGQKMPEFVEVINFMHQRGYVPYDFPGFIRRPLDNALGQIDVCFVKEDGFLRASHSWK